ncbi:MAG: hypothetical protein AAF333_13765 [Planctomycetota bacterium]
MFWACATLLGITSTGLDASAQPVDPLGQVLIVGSDGQPAGTLIPDLDTPRGTALAADGTFFVSVTGGLGSVGGVVLKAEPGGVATPFVTDVTPFDLEIDPASGDLFVSDASGGILRVPVTGPSAGVPLTGPASSTPGVYVDAFVLPGGAPGGPVVPSGIGFGPTGNLFAGLQSSNPAEPGNAGLLEIDLTTGVATQVGILDTPFDVQVDSQGNVFANNIVPGSTVGDAAGEIAFFPGLGAPDAPDVTTPIESETFAPVGIRGLAIGPVGSDIEDTVLASTAALTIVAFDAFDPATFDPAFTGDLFAGPPLSDIQDPFAFDIQFLPGGNFQLLLSVDPIIPEPATAAVMGVFGLALVRRRRGR